MSARTSATFAEFIALGKLDPRRPILQNEIDQIVDDQLFVQTCGLAIVSGASRLQSVSSNAATYTFEDVYGRAAGGSTYNLRCAVRIFASAAGSAFDVVAAATGGGGSVTVFSGDPTTTPTWRVGGSAFVANETDDLTITITRTSGTATAYVCGWLFYST